MSRYKLWGDDYADSFRATEATLVNALTEAEREEDIDGVEQNIKTYKLLLQIPFTTKKNKDQKIKKLGWESKDNLTLSIKQTLNQLKHLCI